MRRRPAFVNLLNNRPVEMRLTTSRVGRVRVSMRASHSPDVVREIREHLVHDRTGVDSNWRGMGVESAIQAGARRGFNGVIENRLDRAPAKRSGVTNLAFSSAPDRSLGG